MDPMPEAEEAYARASELLASGLPADAATALGLLHSAAEAGHVRAQFQLGLLCATGGGGLPRDLAEARRWCKAAADQGLAVAQFNLGLLHAEADQPAEAARWWRIAAINGVAEAAGCLDALYRDEPTGGRPRTWDEADTRASIALERSDPQAVKTVRFAEYYVDPCLDLLIRRHRLDRGQAEDIVQQFFLELEEPLERGEHRGRPWKDSLRERYSQDRGAFRPYLRQALVNFVRDWMRRETRTVEQVEERSDHLADALALRHEWAPLLDAFSTAMAGCRREAVRASVVVKEVLGEGAAQADLCARLSVSERTLRNDLRLGAEMLRDWLAARLSAPLAGPSAEALRAGLDLLPVWLHRPAQEKRGRALLFLVLANRRLEVLPK
jgi:DNA-directed RNA polymerase specialized sigma24 family protein